MSLCVHNCPQLWSDARCLHTLGMDLYVMDILHFPTNFFKCFFLLLLLWQNNYTLNIFNEKVIWCSFHSIRVLVAGFRQNSGLTTLLDTTDRVHFNLCDLQHIVLTGLRSGLVLSLVLASGIHFTACFDVCLWSLSYWKAQLC